MTEDLRDLLRTGALELGIPLASAQVNACLIYLAELKKWNRRINLTAIRNDREAVIKHFLDSFSYLKGLSVRPGRALIDIGSGAGFPALPIKIAAPALAVTLVESVNKKTAFLRHIVRTLGLQDVDVLARRTEDLPQEILGRFDAATARAFAQMEKAVQEGARLLAPGGILVLSRGPEETIGNGAIDRAGMVLQDRLELELPYTGDRRSLWIFRRK